MFQLRLNPTSPFPRFGVDELQSAPLGFSGSFQILLDSLGFLQPSTFCFSSMQSVVKSNKMLCLKKRITIYMSGRTVLVLKDFRAGEVEHHVGLTRTCQRPQFE